MKIHAMPFMNFQWMNDLIFMDEIKIINDLLSKNLSMIREQGILDAIQSCGKICGQ
jgi:hypothetical protein